MPSAPCLLVCKAFAIPRKVLLELGTIVTPYTLLRWHRKLVAQKFDFSSRRGPGRPCTMQVIVELVVAWRRKTRNGAIRGFRVRCTILAMR